MRVVPCVVLAACVCLLPAGCESTNRRPNGNTFAGGGGGSPVAGDPGKRAEPGDPLYVSPGNVETAGFLAGQVINGQTGRPTDASIQWVCLDEAQEDADKKIEVAVKADGYFTIQGLKPGKHYKLVARTRQGDRLLAGVTYAQTPNIRLVIKVKEDLAGATTPDMPPSPAYQQPKKKEAPKDEAGKKQGATRPEQPASAQVPDWDTGPPRVQVNPLPDANKMTPVPGPAHAEQRWDTVPHANQPVPGADPNRIATEVPKKWPPPVSIGPPKVKAPDPPKSWDTPPLQSSLNAPVVPSCVLVGRQLINFALTDLNGQPWVYRERRRGKLTLLDFWGTRCPACLKALPDLVALQNRYGSSGLDVVGIAYENGGTPTEQAQRVNASATRFGVNYQLLLGGGGQCPVLRDFHVTGLPTLVLLDDNGWVVWRHDGPMDVAAQQTLERSIRIRLGVK